MSKPIRHLGVLYNNPFILGHILYSFYKSMSCIDRNVLLAYLVFPLSLYPASQKYLIQKKDPRSCLRILAKEHERLFGLQDRIGQYMNITNITLQYCINIGVMSINSKQSVEILADWPEGYVFPPNASKAAERLCDFVSKYDVPTSYRMLGVKNI